jgi:hypothetical protein
MEKLLKIVLFFASVTILVIFAHFLKHAHKPKISVLDKISPIVRLVDPSSGKTFCSGVVASNTLIFTAAHCVLEKAPFGVKVNTGFEIRSNSNKNLGITSTTWCVHPQLDHAILKGNFSIFNIAASSTKPKDLIHRLNSYMSSTLMMCGYPMGGDLLCTPLDTIGTLGFFWYGEGILIPCMSGGPVFGKDGVVVALNDAVEGKYAIVTPLYDILSGCPNVTLDNK